jgi:hypothetical protein
LKSLLALSSVLLLVTTPVYAQLYKWVDEQGKVHYSDQPPSGKAKNESTLNIPSQPGTTSSPESDKNWQEKELEFQKRQTSAAEAEAKKQKAEQEAKTKRENCEKAKNQLSQLESIAPVYTYDEKVGRTYLNEAQRAEAIEKARKSVSEWCN